MSKISYHILRIGMAVTFLWIGIVILKEPEVWGGYIGSWAIDLLPLPIKEIMIGTAILDIAIGVLFLVDSFVWIASLVASIHLIIVLIVTGITDVTVRDIGILATTLALMIETLPQSFIEKIRSWQKGDK